jgi:hypothetical protein
MSDVYEVTIKSKNTGKEITQEYDMNYLNRKNTVISQLWDKLQDLSKTSNNGKISLVEMPENWE